jgi:3-methyladenine DNA glycosylase AlkD
MTSAELLQQIESVFSKNVDPERATFMEAYMRHQFKFLGLGSPQRKALTKPFLKQSVLPPIEELPSMVRSLWGMEFREYQMVALDLLNRYEKRLTPNHFELLHYSIIHKSWWDTVDGIASNPLGTLVKHHPVEGYRTLDKWERSGHLWLIRSCILFQLKYQLNTNEEYLFGIIRRQAHHPDFFIRKAIGWALRQYGKYHPKKVLSFVERFPLSGLSKREALKHLSNHVS